MYNLNPPYYIIIHVFYLEYSQIIWNKCEYSFDRSQRLEKKTMEEILDKTTCIHVN